MNHETLVFTNRLNWTKKPSKGSHVKHVKIISSYHPPYLAP